MSPAISEQEGGPEGPPFAARNGMRVRQYATKVEAEECSAGYARHPLEIPLGASRAYRDGWYDRESYVLDVPRGR